MDTVLLNIFYVYINDEECVNQCYGYLLLGRCVTGYLTTLY
jgi:hypothetical protein